MNKFEDRTGTNLNRKRLEIENVEENPDGTLKTLYVKEFRNDADGLEIEGTLLNAENLNEIVSNIVEEEIIKYFQEEQKLLDEQCITLTADGSVDVVFEAPIPLTYTTINTTGRFDVTRNNTGTYDVILNIRKNPNLSIAYNKNYYFVVKFYSATSNELYKRVTFVVQFETSESPQD